MYRNVGVNVSEELIDCVDKGDFVSAKKLIDAGADINFQNSVNGYTALMLASRMDDINFVKYLLSKGAKINIKDKYDGNVLNYACLTGQTKIVELLIEKGANINQSKYNAPLSVAARNGHFNIVQILINKGAKIDSKNINDQTALMQACDGGGNYGKNKVVKLLLDSGANLKIKDKKGDTALSLAKRTLDENIKVKEFVEVVQLLKAKGAK